MNQPRNALHEVLLLKRGKNARSAQGQWSRPGGEAHEGESLTDAVKREVREETGVTIEIIRPLDTFEHTTPDGTAWQANGFLARPVGG